MHHSLNCGFSAAQIHFAGLEATQEVDTRFGIETEDGS
jgi:hypothetical protein